jgi:CRISPR system Cascade subunit CasA
VDAAFWSQTEPGFYDLLRARVAALRESGLDDGLAAKRQWLAVLAAAAIQLFDHDFVGAGPIEGQNLARVAQARHQLQVSLRGPKLRAALALPEPPKPTAVKKSSSKSKSAPAGAA